MPDISILAVAAATLAAFLIGGAYYAALGEQLAALSPGRPASDAMGAKTFVVELVRCLLLALVVVGLAGRGAVDTVAGGLVLGLALWIGFPLVLWIGAVVHEHTPVRLAAIHAGDWLVKLPVVAILAAVLQ